MQIILENFCWYDPQDTDHGWSGYSMWSDEKHEEELHKQNNRPKAGKSPSKDQILHQGLFLYNPCFNNGFYTFKWLGK